MEDPPVPPTRVPTHYDPSANDVNDPYMPINNRSYVKDTKGIFNKYASNPNDAAIRACLGESLIPLMYVETAVVPDEELCIVPMDLRGTVLRVDQKLTDHSTEIDLLYGEVRSFAQRLARLEA